SLGDGQYGLTLGELRVLLEHGEGHVLRAVHGAAVGRLGPHQQLEDRRLTRTVAPDERQAPAFAQLQCYLVENDLLAVVLLDAREGSKQHATVSLPNGRARPESIATTTTADLNRGRP